MPQLRLHLLDVALTGPARTATAAEADLSVRGAETPYDVDHARLEQLR